MLHSLLCFLSSRLDKCTGNGEPGVMGCTATAGRLRLGPLGLKNDALGLPSALLARDRDNQLFLGLGQRRVRAETARNLFDHLDSGDGRDLLVDGSCSRQRQLEKACQTSRTLLAGAEHPNHNNQLFLGLGRRRVRAETARNLFDRLDSGDGRDLLVDGSCSRRRQLEKACRTSRTLLAGARTRSHTASERISSRGSLAEPVLRRRGGIPLPRLIR